MYNIYSLGEKKSNNRWIDTNDAETGLSQIQVTNDKCIVPRNIYIDSLVEDEYLNNLLIDNEEGKIIYPRYTLNYIQEKRACIWYPEISNRIPTSDSILLNIISMEKIKLDIKSNIKKYPFIRLCTMSAKDVKRVPIYNINNIDKAIEDIINSNRTNNLFLEPYCENCMGKHIFMRKKRVYLGSKMFLG